MAWNLIRAGFPIPLLVFATIALAACDPVVNIAGANFPAWLLCAILGAVLATAFRPVFVASRMEPYLGPVLVIYPCLAIMLSYTTYILFFNRV